MLKNISKCRCGRNISRFLYFFGILSVKWAQQWQWRKYTYESNNSPNRTGKNSDDESAATIFFAFFVLILFLIFFSMQSSSPSNKRTRINRWVVWRIHLCLVHVNKKTKLQLSSFIFCRQPGHVSMDRVSGSCCICVQHTECSSHQKLQKQISKQTNKISKVQSMHMPFAMARAAKTCPNTLRIVFQRVHTTCAKTSPICRTFKLFIGSY